MCTNGSETPVILWLVTFHWKKMICYQRGLVSGGLCPHDRQKPLSSGTRCGMNTSEAHPEEPEESSANTISPCIAARLWAGNCPLSTLRSRLCLSCPLLHCRLFEYLIILFAFPEKEPGKACAVTGTGGGQQGCSWCRASWPVIPLWEHPPTENPNRWLRDEDVAERGGHAGAFRHQSGAAGRKRKCWEGIKGPGHVVRGKAETIFHSHVRFWLEFRQLLCIL